MYALLLFTTLFISIDSFAQNFRYIPSSNYPLTDFKEFGMIFEPYHQRITEKLTRDLLERERVNGHWSGSRQEDAIRQTVKKYYAISKNVYPGKYGSDSSSSERATKDTNGFLVKWAEEHKTTLSAAQAKENALKEYREAVDMVQAISEGKALRQQERSERSRIETIERGKAKAEWEKRAYEQYDRENSQRASEDKARECEKRCKNQYWDSEILYYRCYNLCKEHEKPKAAPIRHP
jgi:hypothetical protein